MTSLKDKNNLFSDNNDLMIEYLNTETRINQPYGCDKDALKMRQKIPNSNEKPNNVKSSRNHADKSPKALRAINRYDQDLLRRNLTESNHDDNATNSNNNLDRRDDVDVSHKYNDEQRDQFIAQIKRELSLPRDICIPEHYINKRLSLCNIPDLGKISRSETRDLSQTFLETANEIPEQVDEIDGKSRTQLSHVDVNDGKTTKKPSSRVTRRQSLFEIGFGQDKTYQKLRVIGSGSYSCVYKGISRLTNELVALKEISLQRDEGVPFTAIREVSLLKELKHANIITLHDFIYTKKYLTLVFEFMNFDLSVYMTRCDYNIDPRNVKLFLFQLLRGLNYCHDRRILHRDLKPQNLLLNENGELKLADFGLARAKSVPIKTLTDEVVTLWYRPPDVLLGNTDYGPSIDIWGVGCIFYEMATGKTLFTGGSPNHQLKGIFETIGMPNELESNFLNNELLAREIILDGSRSVDFNDLEPRVGSNGIDLLRNFLRCEPKLRISAGEAMRHSYFNTLPDSVYRLSDNQSIFRIQSIKLEPDTIVHPLFDE